MRAVRGAALRYFFKQGLGSLRGGKTTVVQGESERGQRGEKDRSKLRNRHHHRLSSEEKDGGCLKKKKILNGSPRGDQITVM